MDQCGYLCRIGRRPLCHTVTVCELPTAPLLHASRCPVVQFTHVWTLCCPSCPSSAHTQVPWTYIWSPSLVPRPSDWPDNCEVVGFVNVELTKLTQYEPDQALTDFLAAGEGETGSVDFLAAGDGEDGECRDFLAVGEGEYQCCALRGSGWVGGPGSTFVLCILRGAAPAQCPVGRFLCMSTECAEGHSVPGCLMRHSLLSPPRPPAHQL